MKTLLHEQAFAVAVAGVIVFTFFSNITAPLASALRSTPVMSTEVESVARVVVTGKRMSAREKVEYDTQVLASSSSRLTRTAGR